VVDGVVLFAARSNSHGELTREEAQAFATAIRAEGSAAAVARLPREQQRRVGRLALAPARGNVLSLFPATHRGRLLDFGCGYGGVARQLAPHLSEVYALDGSLERLAILRALADEAGLGNVQAVFHRQALGLPFEDDAFDVVLLVGVFEYLPSDVRDCPVVEAHRRCLREFRRVLRPGGRLVIGTHNRFGWQYLLGKRDHGGFRFRQPLPRPVGRLLTSLLGLHAYRQTYHGTRALAALARESFAATTLCWPLPGYQFPESFAELGDRAAVRRAIDTCFSGAKRSAIRALHAVGVLDRVVPYVYLVATKGSG
jgi:SAM-dependent methyltransferase